jgi:hypothetical protein
MLKLAGCKKNTSQMPVALKKRVAALLLYFKE